jgi:putative nucleotidyltransferase with HDIG domain
MAGHEVRHHGRDRWRETAAVVVVVGTLAVVGIVAVFGHPDKVSALSAVLAVAAVVAGWMVAGERDGLSISGSFIVLVLAAAFLGPRSAIIAALLSEATAALRLHTRLRTVVVGNLPPTVIPAAAAAAITYAITGGATNGFRLYVAVGVAAFTAIALSFVIFSGFRRVFLPELDQFGIQTFIDDLPSIGLNTLLAVAGAAITVKLGIAGIAFALSAVLTFSYMAHLVDRARHRSQQYVALSWGVLAGLIRSLDVRDERAARHAAAVAGFSRDIAKAVGMSAEEIELAHTAGLLHDIGHFALSDRVAERGRTLAEEDWEAIHRHPEIGADLLKDLGMYGPVAEIVLAHHERIDGRGYPRGVPGHEIPEIARIIAVAEVYDTLTARDTYRTRMSSFEAIRELRRVAGTQLDGRYVEVLAELLSGEGVEYRHADTADFDAELDMERRIKEAIGGA